MNAFKNNEPHLLAEYVKIMGIGTEPAFNWWVPQAIRKNSRILLQLESLYHKTNLKFDQEMPCSIEHAYTINVANDNHFLRDAIVKEIKM